MRPKNRAQEMSSMLGDIENRWRIVTYGPYCHLAAIEVIENLTAP